MNSDYCLENQGGVVIRNYVSGIATTSDAMIRKLLYSLWQSSNRCDNVIVCSFMSCDMFHCSRTVRWHTVRFYLIINF